VSHLKYRFSAGISKRPPQPGESPARFLMVAAVFMASSIMAGIHALLSFIGDGQPCDASTEAFTEAAFAFAFAGVLGMAMLAGWLLFSRPKTSIVETGAYSRLQIRHATSYLVLRGALAGALVATGFSALATSLGASASECAVPLAASLIAFLAILTVRLIAWRRDRNFAWVYADGRRQVAGATKLG